MALDFPFLLHSSCNGLTLLSELGTYSERKRQVYVSTEVQTVGIGGSDSPEPQLPSWLSA